MDYSENRRGGLSAIRDVLKVRDEHSQKLQLKLLKGVINRREFVSNKKKNVRG